MAGITITDGYTFSESDAQGAFTLDANDQALFISIVTPAGYIAPFEQGVPQFYRVYTPSAKRFDFELQPWPGTSECYELLAIADPQPKTDKHFDRLRTEIIPVLQERVSNKKAEGVNQAAILLGDVVWDSPNLFEGVKEQFASLGIPVYSVIGNHDHDLAKYTDRESTETYRSHFGPTYYAFDMGKTHYIVLDDIIYYGAKKYEEQIDSMQLNWAKAYAERLPAGSRVCIAIHAPVLKSWINHTMESAEGLMDAFAAHEVHFISGHTHINSNYDLRDGIMEHNVAQISGNLWWDPINNDGTPKGYQLFRECGDCFSWQYQSIATPSAKQLRVWSPGEVKEHPAAVVAKIWNWDSHWTVVWYEDGRYRGSMQRTQLADPDYTTHIDSLKATGQKLAGPQKPRPTNFYFTARPSASAQQIEIVATDRFGRRYSESITLKISGQ
jgi:calcineurin-like phosphoesterase